MRLARGVILFASPLLAGALVFETLLWRTGESWPIAYVVRRQSEISEAVFGRAYLSHQFNLYKLDNIRSRSPEILIVGSSRVMEFRSFFFHPYDSAFYNGGGLIQTDQDLIEYAREVRSGVLPAPKALIVGIEPWWFKPGAPRGQWIADGASTDASLSFGAHVNAARSVLKSHEIPFWAAVAGKLEETPAYGYPGIGLGAVVYGEGERNDGSHLYTVAISDFLRSGKFHDRFTPTILERVRGQSYLFTPAPSLDRERIRSLIAALESLRARGVAVETYLPPFTDEVLAALNQAGAGWWIDYRDRLPVRLREAGFVCLPSASPADFGLDDRYMFDGFHPSEVFDSHLAERLVRAAPPGSFLATVNLNHLETLRARPGVLPVAFDSPQSLRSTDPN